MTIVNTNEKKNNNNNNAYSSYQLKSCDMCGMTCKVM